MLPWLVVTAALALPPLGVPAGVFPGGDLDVQITGATPGARVFVVGSLGAGEVCAPRGCLDLAPPVRVLASPTAGPDGSADVRLRVPELAPGASLWLQAVAPDGFDPSPAAEVPVVAPVAPTARLVPPRPWAGESLACVTSDAGAVTWTVDGVPWGGPTEDGALAGDRIPSGHLADGEVWRCAATGPGGDAVAEVAVAAPLGGNVLVLLADDLGVERLDRYGGVDPIPTPHLDALADEGVLFTNATAHATCSPTRAALLTGRHARRTGVGVRIGTLVDAWELPLEEVLIPEVLVESALGYTSVALGKWHLAANASPSGFSHPLLQGFEHHRGAFGNLQIGHELPDDPLDYYHWSKLDDGVPSYSDTYATTDTVDDALAELADRPEPWFLYVAFNAPHDPFHFPPLRLFDTPVEFDATDAEKWAVAVEAMDTEIGRLLDSMDPEVRARTTVVFMGDNGWPEQVVVPPFDPLRAKTSLYQGGVRVPLIVSGPAVTAPGSTSDAMVADVDLLPTVAELAGVRLPDPGGVAVDTPLPDLVLDGESWVPLLTDPAAEADRDVLFLERFSPLGELEDLDLDETAVRDGRWKYVVYTAGDEELFDLSGDPFDDGPDLLDAPLSDEAAAAYDRMVDALAAERTRVGAD